MGCGTISHSSLTSYAVSRGRTYDTSTGRVKGQTFEARSIDPALDPRGFKVRECCNSDEHPNTVPVILGLDVTGSMGEACAETAAALGKIVTSLYNKFADIEFCIMGIGDLDYDHAPIQMSQFESDVRIAVSLDKVYMEHGGGGNSFESYTAAWYMGLKRTKLDCYDKQGRKGIIITMGDEPLNPYLPARELNAAINGTEQADIETAELYNQASQKFDIFHIAVDSPRCCYRRFQIEVDNSFGQQLGSRYKVSSIDSLAQTIEDCIAESVQGMTAAPVQAAQPANGNGISW
jgi:hypothetical protein